MKTIPMPLAREFILSINSTEAEATANNNTNWHSAISFLYTQLPAFAKSGLMGYFFSGPLPSANSSSGEVSITSPPPTSGPLFFALVGWVLDQPESSIRAAFAPTLAQLNSTTGLDVAFIVAPPVPFYNIIATNADTVGTNVRLGSRLWDEKALKDRAGVENVIRKLVPTGMSGLLVTGPGVWAVGKDTSAANPAWRDAVVHLSESPPSSFLAQGNIFFSFFACLLTPPLSRINIFPLPQLHRRSCRCRLLDQLSSQDPS
jgi:hypothetical protein